MNYGDDETDNHPPASAEDRARESYSLRGDQYSGGGDLERSIDMLRCHLSIHDREMFRLREGNDILKADVEWLEKQVKKLMPYSVPPQVPCWKVSGRDLQFVVRLSNSKQFMELIELWGNGEERHNILIYLEDFPKVVDACIKANEWLKENP